MYVNLKEIKTFFRNQDFRSSFFMVAELIGPPGSGKTYLSKSKYKNHHLRGDIRRLKGKRLLNFIIVHFRTIIILMKYYFLNANKKRIYNLIYECYLLYLVKSYNVTNVMMDQSLIQSIAAFYVETDDIQQTKKIFEDIESFYCGIVDKVIYVKSGKNIERLSKRVINDCSFDIYDENTSEIYIRRYYYIFDLLFREWLKDKIELEEIWN
jgi:hypothetical protein